MTTEIQKVREELHARMKERVEGMPVGPGKNIEAIHTQLQSVVNEFLPLPFIHVGTDVEFDVDTGEMNVTVEVQLGKPDETHQPFRL